MPEIQLKNNFLNGLNLDDSPYELPNNVYIDALNVTRDAVAGGKDYSITNIVGNRKVNYTFPEGTGKVIGRVSNPVRNTELFFRYNSDGYDGVYEYDRTNNVINKVFECLTDSDENILNFTSTDLIVNANIYNRPLDEGDLLFFLDCLGRPTVINIQRFKNGEYTPVTRDVINVIKRPPLVPPTAAYGNDTSTRANNLRNKLFKFQYIWVYDDFEESCPGPESAVPYPANILSDDFTNIITNNNYIALTLESGPKNVKSVKLLMSWVQGTNQWSDFVVVDTINKSDLSIDDNTVFPYDFYNDSVYPIYEVDRRIQLYDYVPKYALSQDMPNGNVVAYGGITEGLSRDLDPNVTLSVLTTPAGSGAGTGSLTGKVDRIRNVFPLFLEYFISFTGTPVVGTVVNVRLTRNSDSTVVTVGTYTTVANDTELEIRQGLRTSMNAINIVQSVDLNSDGTLDFQFNPLVYTYNTIEIVFPNDDAANNSIATFPFFTQRRLGIAYFDQNGVTNGILYNEGLTFPAYAENGSQEVLLPYINVKIYHTPPEWAYSYQILLTKDNTQYVYWYTISVDESETEFLYFEVTNMVLNAEKNPTDAAVLAWDFVDGDRLRVIRNSTDDTVLGYTYETGIIGILTNPKINNVDKTGTFIKIKKDAPFSTYANWGDDEFVIQLFRPTQQEATDDTLTYYELGVQNNILEPGTSNRVHAGSVTNQDGVIPAETNIFSGDSYFRRRTVYTSETGLATYSVQDRNFVDFYQSAVNSISGRPNIVDENLKETFFGAVIRFGESYQPNTNINGLNRFPFLNFFECDASFGSIYRMKVRDRFMRIFQELKTGVSYLFSQVNKQPSGDVVTVVTNQLLNPIQYYTGNHGIGDQAAGLASYNNSDYFTDPNRGTICRVTEGGVEMISVLYKTNSWATANIPLRKGEYKVIGIYDPRSNNYIVTLERALLPNSLIVGNEGVINYSGSYLVSEDLEDACSAQAATYYHGTPFGTGTIIYTDASLSTVLTGFNYIVNEDQIYEIDDVTGEVGAAVEGGICGVGTLAPYKIGNSTDTICAATFVYLYTNGDFAVGKIMYYDSSLLVPVTGNDYIVHVNGGGDIYNLNTSTGEVGSDTTIQCDAGIAGLYILGNELSEICNGTEVTKYTSTAFGTGVTLYNDSSITAPTTGFSYVVDVATNMVYEINSATGVVGADTTLTCEPGTNQFDVQNNSTGSASITNVTPVTYIIDSGAFPLANGESISGTHGGSGSEFTVSITVSGGGPYNLNLFRNGFLLETINVATTDDYTFGSFDMAATDDILITLTDA